ncbi:MAG TPA: hypothetical protein VNL71_24905, partial [Chloroflexota bacterium]|nr:hypothetical protein [Chloroflexota bacterium]
PLEAMAAALAGLPLAGLLGAFFAVPIVAFAHIVARGVIHARHHEEPAPSGEGSAGGKKAEAPSKPLTEARAPG